LGDFPESWAGSDDISDAEGGGDFFAQVMVFLFESSLQKFNFLEGTGICDADRRMIGEDTEPVEIGLAQFRAIEEAQHSKHFAAKNQWLGGKSSDVFGADPLRFSDPLLWWVEIPEDQCFTGFGDVPDLANSEGKPAESAVEPGVNGFRNGGISGAGNEVKTFGMVWALGAESAGFTKISRGDQPDSREGDILAFGDAAHDRLEDFGQGSVLGHGNHDLREIGAIHGAEAAVA